MPNFKTSIGRLRVVGMCEGISFLLLMGVAMPLKYMAGMPEAVKWTGWAHGLLFVLYCMAIFNVLIEGKLSFGKCVLAFVAALLPFGPFIIDKKLAADEAREIPDAD